jgi:ribosomal protein L32E
MMLKKIFTTLLIISVQVVTAHPGIGIVEDSRGNIFYTDLEHVWKIDVAGTKSIAVKNVHTHELFLDEQDNLFGENLWYNGEKLNTWGHYVWKFSSQGKFEKIIPDTEGFLENYSFVRDHFGRMYWADRKGPCQHVVRKNQDNTLTSIGSDCLENIRWLKSTASGDIYVVDLMDLKKIDQRGITKTIASKIADRKLSQFHVADQHAVFGIWDDKEGNVYTAVYSGRMVKRFSPDGKEKIVAETTIPWSPSGGLISRSGDLWLLECSITNSVRVERISKDGKRKVF